MSSTPREETPLLPGLSARSPGALSVPSYDAQRSTVSVPEVPNSVGSSSATAPAVGDELAGMTAPPQSSSTRVRVGRDAAVLDAQKKWKRLTEISDDNSTAKDMASEVQSEFAALQLQQQQQQQQQHHVDILDAVGSEPLLPRASHPPQQQQQQHAHARRQHHPSRHGHSHHHQQQQLLQHPQSHARDATLQDIDEDGDLELIGESPARPPQPPSASMMVAHVDKYLVAAAFIRDGIHGRKIGYRLDRTALFLHRLFHSSSYRLLYTLIVLVSCALAFVERPGEQNDYLAVDLTCIVLFCGDVFIRWHMSSAETKRKFLSRQPWACVRMILLLLTFADLALNALLPQWNPYRYSRALRPFFLICRRRNIRIIFGSCLRAFREVLIVLGLMFCLIGFFGLLGYLVFSDASNAVSAPYFNSLSSSLYTMLLIHNCLPYMVKSMYPYFQLTQWSALFFVIFVLLTNLFLAKLTIAVSYKSYKQHTEKMLYKRLQKRKAALFAAFDILAEDVDLTGSGADLVAAAAESHAASASSLGRKASGFLKHQSRRGSSRFFSGSALGESKRGSFAMITPIRKRWISLETWIQVCEHLKPKWTSVECTLVFNTVDVEHIGYVDLSDFYQLCSLLSVKLERTQPSTAAAILQRCFPSVQRQTVRRWQVKLRGILLYEKILFGRYPVVIAELVVGSLICLSVVQAVQVNNIELAFSVNRSWRVVGFVLLCLFTLEVQLKLFAFGRREFFSRPFCKLDLAIALVGWTFYVITSMKDPPNVSLVFYDLALAVRSLRILKLLNLFPPFHEILWTMQRILPLIVQLLLVIVSFMYAFAIFTQANYGLALREFPASKQSLSPQWYNVRKEFQVDTFEETLVTLFGVANLAGWDIVMDAAHAVTNSDATYVFFFSYRIAMANILLPIFVGFLVESFVSNAKTVEDTIETYVEAASAKIRQQRLGDATMTLEEERLAVLEGKEGDELFNVSNAQSPASTSSDRGFRMRFERRGSLVQNEMFDAVRISDMSRLKLMIERKDEEIANQDVEIRQLEGTVLSMQSRLSQSQRIILAYETKLEELSAQLRAAAQLAAAAPSSSSSAAAEPSLIMTSPPLPTTVAPGAAPSSSSKRRAASWKVWK